ncbi:717_t:CDS:2 [Acaulospora morrowiae]|uniref:717_t:CDS:1 n=1 Tax=Acaulospora morrowiae TaxID=94023 RepID=A0A9N9FGN4_9GLOM|nr:717_t:CDS:2 [Acaulospora morrowiae]
MSFSDDKENCFQCAIKGGFIKVFNYNSFENIKPISEKRSSAVLKEINENVSFEYFYKNNEVYGNNIGGSEDASSREESGDESDMEESGDESNIDESEDERDNEDYANNEYPEKFFRVVENMISIVSNEYVIQFMGVCKDPERVGRYFMVLQYVGEENLKTFLKKNTDLDWRTKVKISKYVSYGLNYIHNAGVAHCNLSTKNIVKGHGDRWLITNFGSSKSLNLTTMNKDIFDLGELFVEISIGRSIDNFNTEIRSHSIGTPIDYIDLCREVLSSSSNYCEI